MAARAKLQRVVAEAIEAEHARSLKRLEALHSENIALVNDLSRHLDDVLNELRNEIRNEATDHRHLVIRRIEEFEHRTRRDISYSQDVAVVAESAEFVAEHLAKSAVFWHPHDTLRFALSEVHAAGLALEFGVASGTTLGIIADAVAGERKVVGFDTFSGLPETWRTGFPAGLFARDQPPEVSGAELVTGLFEETLPDFLARSDEPIAFMHLDADLYSSTKTVLDLTADRLTDGAVLVFDEFFNYPGWQGHEFRAWNEFITQTGRTFDYLAYTGNDEQVVVRLH